MKAEYDLTKMKSRRNPYAKLLKKQITIRVDISNETTRKTFEDTDAGRNLMVCEDTKGMFEKLGI